MESDHLFELNYAITLYKHGDSKQCQQHFARFKELWAELDDDVKNADPGVEQQYNQLRKLLKAQ